MQPWLKRTLIVVAVLVLVGGAFVAYAEYSNGKDVNVALNLGTSGSAMYLRCDAAKSSPGVCSGGDQATVTVHKRDRVHLSIHNDQGGDHTHDFNVQGWQYAFPPVSPEMELHSVDQSWTFTAWAAGSYHMLCELPGHEAAGMQGTFVVV
jgi:plastocyanin